MSDTSALQSDHLSTGREDAAGERAGGNAHPGPPRRRPRVKLDRLTIGFGLVLLALVGFFVGVKVEKHSLTVGSTSSASFAALAARAREASGTRTGARFGLAAAAGAGGFAGFGGAGTGVSGTVASVDGSTVYVTETSGLTVAVPLTSGVKVTKSETVTTGQLHAGDTVTLDGASGSGDTFVATEVTDLGDGVSVSDFGTGAAGSMSGSSTSGGPSSSSSSSESSLFGS